MQFYSCPLHFLLLDVTIPKYSESFLCRKAQRTSFPSAQSMLTLLGGEIISRAHRQYPLPHILLLKNRRQNILSMRQVSVVSFCDPDMY